MFAGTALSVRLFVCAGLSLFIIYGPYLYVVVCVLYAYNLTPDLCNTRVDNLIENRLQLRTAEGRILFSSPALSEFFKTSNFELDLQTGEVLTYLNPPENIGITCQKEPFDIESLRDTLQGENNAGPTHEERLERIPSV